MQDDVTIWQGDSRELLASVPDHTVDLICTDPPYNLQLPMTMAGGALAETHANRRTDYAMVTDSALDLANAAGRTDRRPGRPH